MDILGYFASNKFIVAATSTSYNFSSDGKPVQLESIRKIHKINDHAFYTVVGEPFKSSKVVTFFDELYRLQPSGTYDEIIQDFTSTFNVSSLSDIDSVKGEGGRAIRQNVDINDVLDTNSLLKSLESGSDTESILKELLGYVKMGVKYPMTILFWGSEPDKSVTRTSKYLMLGNFMNGADVLPLQKDNYVFEFVSATESSEQLTEISQRYINQLKPSFFTDWEDSPESIPSLVQAVKSTLIQGLTELGGLSNTNIVFYELSAETGFLVKEPDQPLKPLYFQEPS